MENHNSSTSRAPFAAQAENHQNGMYAASLSTFADIPQMIHEAHVHPTELERREEETPQQLQSPTAQPSISEERFQRVLQSSLTTVFTHDRELRYTWINNPLAVFSIERMLGKTDSDWLPPTDAARLMSLKRRALQQGQSVQELVYLNIGGQRRWFDMKVEPFYDPDGSISGLTCAATDVTTYQRIAHQQRLLAEVSDHLTSSFNSTTFDTITSLHDAARLLVEDLADLCIIHRLLPDGSIENPVIIYHDSDYEAAIQQAILSCAAASCGSVPLMQILREGRSIYYPQLVEPAAEQSDLDNLLTNQLRAAGATSYIGVPLRARGKLIGALSLVRNQTRQLNSYSEDDFHLAHQLSRRFALALDNIHLYAAEQQSRQRVEQVARRIARLQTVTAALVEALSFDQIAAIIVEQGVAALGAYAGCVMLLRGDGQRLRVVRAQGYENLDWLSAWDQITLDQPYPMCKTVREGVPVWIESRPAYSEQYQPVEHIASDSQSWATLPLVVDTITVGGIMLNFAQERSFSREDRAFMVALAQQCSHALDRTRLYEAEQRARSMAEAAVQMRDQVFQLISHDLRAPLTAIRGYAHILRRRILRANLPEPEQFTAQLTQIEAATVQMSAQIQELLDVATVQAGQSLALSIAPLDLVALTRQVAETARYGHRRHTVQINAIVPRLMISADAARLERVISNLLSNAFKYSPNGGIVTVTIAQETNDSRDWATIAVTDQGIGIPAEDLPHIFDMFRRGSNAQKQFLGHGLGLTSAHQIIERHGGELHVSSTEGHGSTFTLRLPLMASA